MKAPEFYRWFGQKVKSRRMELGIAQEDLATVLGILRSAMSAIEKGTRQVTFYESKVLHSCLGIRPSYSEVSEAIAKRHVPKLKILVDKRNAEKFAARIGRMEGEE